MRQHLPTVKRRLFKILIQIMESDKSVYYTFKYLPLIRGVVIGLGPLLGHLNPEISTFNGEPGPPDFGPQLFLS